MNRLSLVLAFSLIASLTCGSLAEEKPKAPGPAEAALAFANAMAARDLPAIKKAVRADNTTNIEQLFGKRKKLEGAPPQILNTTQKDNQATVEVMMPSKVPLGIELILEKDEWK